MTPTLCDEESADLYSCADLKYITEKRINLREPFLKNNPLVLYNKMPELQNAIFS